MRFLLRNIAYHQHPVCTHTLNALDRTQKELDLLKTDYFELYQYLEPKHILALKWGILFHDIGKLVKPEYFSENQRGANPHEEKNPSMSALVIKAHVKEGVEMAKKEKLPKVPEKGDFDIQEVLKSEFFFA